MHMPLILLAAAAALAATPAAAVTLTSTTATGGNTATPVETGSSQISVDFGINAGSPISLDFQVGQNDAASYFFDSAVSVFTGVNPALRRGIAGLSLSLTGGATFTRGDVSPAFSTATTSLNRAGDRLVIRFAPDENVGIDLGSFSGTLGDFLINRNGLAVGDTFGLAVQGAVPDAATWMTMILGFGLLGTALRRRRTAAAATA